MKIKEIPTEKDLEKYMEENNVKEELGRLFMNKNPITFDEVGISLKELFEKYDMIIPKDYKKYKYVYEILKTPIDNITAHFMLVDICVILKQKKRCNNCNKYIDINFNYCTFCGNKL